MKECYREGQIVSLSASAGPEYIWSSGGGPSPRPARMSALQITRSIRSAAITPRASSIVSARPVSIRSSRFLRRYLDVPPTCHPHDSFVLLFGTPGSLSEVARARPASAHAGALLSVEHSIVGASVHQPC